MINYFELYQLPVTFVPDQELVKSKYYDLSRQFHPDRFTQGGQEAMDEALKMSSLNNEAYNTLKDPDRTMKYVLKYQGVLEEEEKYDLPPNFLMEMMELNEAVSEYELEPENEDMKNLAVKTLNDLLDLWQEDVNNLVKRYEEGEKSAELLKEIKDYYFRKKYLLRIKERISSLLG
jgi:molecular chaperone HscB